MVNSMTAFGTASGSLPGLTWAWELRSVNGRGLDIRLRLPDGCEGLETMVRKSVAQAATRGNITVGLKIKQDRGGGSVELDEGALSLAIAAASQAAKAAKDQGLETVPFDPVSALKLPGVFAAKDTGAALSEATKDISKDFQTALDTFKAARAAEGAALKSILKGQIDRIAELTKTAQTLLEPRAAAMAETLRANIAKVLQDADGVDEQRLAQELAVLAVKSDVAEELDRLTAHISAARDLLATKGPIGRKFDFLTQEFNREANTLCSKANFTELTQVGLDLKTVIDQMREQVQNVE